MTVCNQGTALGSTQVALLLSSDNVIAAPVPSLPAEVQDQLVGAVSTDWLYPEQCQTISISGMASVPAEGAYFLGAVATPDPSQRELIADTNAKAGTPITVTPRPARGQ